MISNEIRNQIIAVQQSGRSNMLDYWAVQKIAFDMGFYDLVCLIEENRHEYINFIFYGDKKCTI